MDLSWYSNSHWHFTYSSTQLADNRKNVQTHRYAFLLTNPEVSSATKSFHWSPFRVSVLFTYLQLIYQGFILIYILSHLSFDSPYDLYLFQTKFSTYFPPNLCYAFSLSQLSWRNNPNIIKWRVRINMFQTEHVIL
jgi:hypothetical protein